jgi:pilus assembly protein CpaC
VDALKQHNLVKVLAEPTLIALSGREASFLAGGEFPIPVPQALGVVTISYKSFGVGLVFTPTVLSPNKINMTVAPEVSDLDFANAISIQGFLIPSITTRRASTTIELADGQSFAIAGLLRDTVREQIAKFPVLGDIPILGALFRSSSFQKNETELIIIVTPHLVKPLDLAKQTLPTGQFIEPNDLEFYLMGQTEGSSRGPQTIKSLTTEGGLEGESGHLTR